MQPFDCLIVGAGAAGLAAARRLLAAGHHPLVLEARDRIGGRIHTDRSHGPAELGAEFIHGDRARTWEVVRAAGLAATPWSGPRRFGVGGRILPPGDPLEARVLELYAAVTGHRGPDIAAADLLDRLAPRHDPARVIAERWLANMEGADTARLSAAALTREREQSTNGETNFHLDAGYDRVVARLAEGLEIRLGAAVAQVTWSDAGVALDLADGARLAARQAILTVPLGVLQAGRPAFAPELPLEKRQAIQAIAMGHVTKLLLWFERRLWPDFTVLSTDGRIATWWPVESATAPALMGYQGGRQALEVAAMGQEQAIAVALEELSTLFGADLRAACLGGRLADWSQDPWSLGAYSYSPVGMGDARTALAAPLAGSLFFAGEATVTGGHIATVHGAIESGERAAAEILKAG